MTVEFFQNFDENSGSKSFCNHVDRGGDSSKNLEGPVVITLVGIGLTICQKLYGGRGPGGAIDPFHSLSGVPKFQMTVEFTVEKKVEAGKSNRGLKGRLQIFFSNLSIFGVEKCFIPLLEA